MSERFRHDKDDSPASKRKTSKLRPATKGRVRKNARDAKRNAGEVLPGNPVIEKTAPSVVVRETKKARTPPPEKATFDPHSVATAQTLDEQKKSQEMRAHLAGIGIIPQEEVRPPDVDISRSRVSQFESRADTQAELDALIKKVDTRTAAERLAEAEELLRLLPGMFGAGKNGSKGVSPISAKTLDIDVSQSEPQVRRPKKISSDREAEIQALGKARVRRIIMQNDVAEIAARNAASRPPVADPDAPTVKMSVPVHIPVTEFSPAAEPEAEETAETVEGSEALPSTPQTEIPAENDELVGFFKEKKESPMPAVFRNIRGRLRNAAVETGTSLPEPKQREGGAPRAEGTRREWRERLRGAVWGFIDSIYNGENSSAGAQETGGSTKIKVKENIEWWKSSEEGLIRRREELDAQAEKIPGMERFFRMMGEEYNKLGWKSKLAVGIGLGVGAGVSAATVSMPGIIAFTLGITAQRTAGLMTMFLKYEKSAQEGEWRKEKAFGKAFAYTAAMTGAMMLLSEGVKEGVEYTKQHQWVERVREWWLGEKLGHHAPASETAGVSLRVTGRPGYETPGFVHPGTAEPMAPDHHVPTAALDFKAPVAAPDIRSPGDIRAFEAAREVAAALAPSSEMPTVGASAGHGYEYMMKRMWEQLQSQHLDASKFDANSDIHKLLTADATTIDKVVHQIAADPKHSFFNPDGTSVQIDPTAHMTVVDGQLHVADAAHPDMIRAAPDMHTTPVYHPDASAAPAAVPESSMIPLHSDEHPLVWHQLGATVSPSESHIYADTSAKKLFVFGGSSEEKKRIITEYLAKHRDKIIYAADASGAHRIPWFRDLNGKLTQGPPVRIEGLLGLFSPLMKPPGPDELGKIIV